MLSSFRFWGSERGCEPFILDMEDPDSSAASISSFQQSCVPDSSSLTTPCASPTQSKKRSRDGFDADDESFSNTSVSVDDSSLEPSAKRARFDGAADMASPPETVATSEADCPVNVSDVEQATDAIHYQFGLEILLKHDELRLINQELAKCQVALEQLRRCHLIPYPVSCPTPDQMLDIATGKGPAVQKRPGELVPEWAAPFGVVDGPYARHYAKWLIPDPKFDGMQPEWKTVVDNVAGRSRVSAEGRSTRNSGIIDVSGAPSNKSRSVRAGASHKLPPLSTGYAQPKDKAGPCVLKRSDGQTVKLVCIDCHRENFSSTQGFINHCRIAHKRDFKSHEEAAVHCGHPLEANEPTPVVSVPAPKEKKTTPVAPCPPAPSGLVHPLAHSQMTDQEAYTALTSRITDSLKLYRQGKLPGVSTIPGSSPKPETSASGSSTGFTPDPSLPFLSRYMQKKNFQGNLSDAITDAKKKLSMDDLFSPGDDTEDGDQTPVSASAGAARAPVVMRVPAGMNSSPAPTMASARPASSKGAAPNLQFAPSVSTKPQDGATKGINMSDDDVDMDSGLSPNTLVSNNAPSLVSDDGEYDDSSDDGSTMSDASDNMRAESVSDVAEITMDEDNEPRSIRHHRPSSGMGSEAMQLKKEEPKHVTFINPAKNNNPQRPRKQ